LSILKTFLIDIGTHKHRVDLDKEIYPAQGSLEVAKQSMMACGSLLRIGFPVWDITAQVIQNASYIRSDDGKVKLEGLDVLNESSWREI
jgi:hypothetical protein